MRNVVDATEIPSADSPTMPTMAVDDIARFLRAAFGTFYYVYALFYAALTTDMRLGELLGLCWCDVDLEMGFASALRALYKRDGVIGFEDPKGTPAAGAITLPASLAELLRAHRIDQEVKGILLGRNISGMTTSSSAIPVVPRLIRVR